MVVNFLSSYKKVFVPLPRKFSADAHESASIAVAIQFYVLKKSMTRGTGRSYRMRLDGPG